MRSVLPYLLVPILATAVAHASPASGPAGPGRILFAPIGEGNGSYFGWSVCGAADVNGDGYADVIVGSPRAGSGRAYVYYGGPNADSTPDLVLGGDGASGADFGSCVSGAGDVNGDGYADIIVGAPGEGRVYVYLGGPNAGDVPALALASPEPPPPFPQVGDRFGVAVAGVGDVNGDGYADFVIGAPGGGSRYGRVYVYFGGPQLHSTPDVILTGRVYSRSFGSALAGAGDMNRDGYADIIVGEGGGLSDVGHAYVYYGGAQVHTVPDVTLTGEFPYTRFGVAVAGAGDVNGDGYADVIVGAEGDFAGRAYVYYGGPGMSGTPDLVFTGSGSMDLFGFTVAGAGDVNGDGYSDLLVGAAWDGTAGDAAGRVYIYYGGPAADATPDAILTGEGPLNLFGEAIAGAGDVDGDGCADVIVGAWSWTGSIVNSPGRAYVISTQPAPLQTALEIDPRVVNLKSHASLVTAYIKPSGFDPSAINRASLRLEGVAPEASKTAVVGDYDADGVPDLMVKFSRAQLDPLLKPGVNMLKLTGSLATGQRFWGIDSIRVIDPGRGPSNVSVAPNPLNPSGVLRFETAKPGPVRVQIFDDQGRLVRTVLDLPQAASGAHEVRIEAVSGGASLGSGVYFLQIHTASGDQAKRIVVLK